MIEQILENIFKKILLTWDILTWARSCKDSTW